MNIWCPGCGCDVQDSVSRDVQKQYARLKKDKQQIKDAVRFLRSVVNNMEAHAQKKTDVLRPVSEIYRRWSDELFTEMAGRFPLTAGKSKIRSTGSTTGSTDGDPADGGV